MQTTDLSLLVGDIKPIPSLNRFGSEVDLSDFRAEQIEELQVCVNEFKAAGRRLALELYHMTSSVVRIKAVVEAVPYGQKRKFDQFAASLLGVNERTVRRYVNLYHVISAHFKDGPNLRTLELEKFTQEALNLLSPSTDHEVIVELRALAQGGEKLTAEVVNDVIERLGKDHTAELAGKDAELRIAETKCAELSERLETESAKYERRLNSNTEQIRRHMEHAKSVEEELEQIKKAPAVVSFTNVPTIPPGFKSIEDAIAQKTAELNQVNAAIQAAQVENERIIESTQKLGASLDILTQDTGEFFKLRDSIEDLISKFPAALVRAMATTEPKTKTTVAALGRTLVEFGNQLVASTQGEK